jgi:hypothetical protein
MKIQSKKKKPSRRESKTIKVPASPSRQQEHQLLAPESSKCSRGTMKSLPSIMNCMLAVAIVISAIFYNARLAADPSSGGSGPAATSTAVDSSTLDAFPGSTTTSSTANTINTSAENKIQNFLTWLKDNGANISEHVTLAEFPEYGGGYGLFAIPSAKEKNHNDDLQHDSEHGTEIETETETVLHALDEMFTIPANLITSTQSVLRLFQTVYAQFTPGKINHLVQSHFPQSTMVQQDAIISMHLMHQCSLGKKSYFKPYLDLLPQKTIPRLDTFQQDHFDILNDSFLANVAKESKDLLFTFYHDANVQFILEKLRGNISSLSAGSSASDSSSPDASCWDFDSFHRFVSISSSRAMVLYGQKYLTPLAEFANYKPRPKEAIDSGATHTFTLFHEKNDDGSITVRADRDVVAGQQIFEDYGDLDNSLFLEAHGFVPDENPFHCASIGDGRYLLDEIQLAGLMDAMIRLGMMPSSGGTNMMEYVPLLCVREDGRVDDLRTVKFLTIVALSREPKQLKRCVDARTMASAEAECLHYLGKTPSWKRFVRQLARRAYCDSNDSLAQDEALLQSMESSASGERESVAPSSIQTILALKFRIADKRVLARVGDISFEQCSELKEASPAAVKPDTVVEQVSNLPLTQDRKEEIQSAVERFNIFIDSLDLPICNVRASYIDENMRVGVVATNEIQEGEIYLSMPPSSSIISLETATIEKGSSLANKLLNVLKSHRRDGGVDTLLFYLLHETYLAKEESKWYPYLRMLPSLDDLKRHSPLFFEQDMFDYLAGSDVRSSLIEQQQRAREDFQEFAKNADIVKVLGLQNVSLDKYLWAYAIIHSRSIWWNGMRHLVPMLDLINCAEMNNSEGKIAAAHKTSLDEDNNAITKASITFGQGDQVFENYSQPNQILFLYHGFVIEENSQDCILVKSIGDHSNKGIEESEENRQRLVKNGFRSFIPSVCIRDMPSLDSLANLIRIKNKLPGDNLGLSMDTIHFVKEELLRRSRLYDDVGNRFETHGDLSYPMRAMRTIVRGEKQILEFLLNDIDAAIQRASHQ